jgi:hypothetical protein
MLPDAEVNLDACDPKATVGDSYAFRAYEMFAPAKWVIRSAEIFLIAAALPEVDLSECSRS